MTFPSKVAECFPDNRFLCDPVNNNSTNNNNNNNSTTTYNHIGSSTVPAVAAAPHALHA